MNYRAIKIIRLKRGTCMWVLGVPAPQPEFKPDWYDPNTEVYFTECGRAYVCQGDNLSDLDFRYCPWCGKKIVVTKRGE